MQSLQYAITGSETIAVWPNVTASLASNPNARYQMVLSSDYGEQEATVDLTLLNTPSSVHPRLVFSFLKSSLPEYTGNYTFTIRESEVEPDPVWGLLSEKWSLYDQKWSIAPQEIWIQIAQTWSTYPEKWSGAEPEPILFTIIETDRAWIEGSDVPTFKQYSVPTNPGAYNIYHG